MHHEIRITIRNQTIFFKIPFNAFSGGSIRGGGLVDSVLSLKKMNNKFRILCNKYKYLKYNSFIYIINKQKYRLYYSIFNLILFSKYN